MQICRTTMLYPFLSLFSCLQKAKYFYLFPSKQNKLLENRQMKKKKSVNRKLIICMNHFKGYLWSKLYQILKSQALSCLVLLLSGPSVILICTNTENVELEVFLQTLQYLSVSQGAHLQSYLDQSPLPLCERKEEKKKHGNQLRKCCEARFPRLASS